MLTCSRHCNEKGPHGKGPCIKNNLMALKMKNILLLNSIAYFFRHCGLQDPSWAELRHFVSFLNVQLLDCDMSSFCSAYVAEDLPGFRMFVVKSMIQMSRDFATRSLNISEQTPGIQGKRAEVRS